ncbi:TIM barrel metal-dependent hydrolase [Xylaria arbuscula]|nr:TIM barrel metal-dependent hydrolase [Xylaria arbuscula]
MAVSLEPSIKPRPRCLANNQNNSCQRRYSSAWNLGIPNGSWDSHMHIIDTEKYPLPENAKRAHDGKMPQALMNAARLGLPNMVFVQLSSYGNDNTSVLDALKEVGPARGRGVVAFDPEHVDSQTLHEWHDLGVRGVRINLRSSKTEMSKAEIQSTLRQYAEVFRPMKTWSIGLYADMEVLDHIQPLVPELQIKLVLEHLASPSGLPLDPARQPGWEALKAMMDDPLVYVKISGPYLFSKKSSFDNFETLVKALLSMRRGEGVVFASDWPHTQAQGYDIMPFMKKVVEWCDGNEKLQERLFRDNARILWDV